MRQALHSQLGRCVDLFREWDEDGSGTITAREFRHALPLLGLDLSRTDSDALFASLDADGSGTIEYGEKRLAELEADFQ